MVLIMCNFQDAKVIPARVNNVVAVSATGKITRQCIPAMIFVDLKCGIRSVDSIIFLNVTICAIMLTRS